MIDIQIDAELQSWIDPLSSEEYALLEASILQDGCRDPLVVWDGYLLDGHNRYAICTEHDIAFQTFEKSGLKTKSDVKIWMIENQIGKRNMTDYSRTVLALKLKPLLEQRAQSRMLSGKSDPTQNSAGGIGETRIAVAKSAGVSHDTVRKVELIEEKAAPEVRAQVRAGEISINAAAKTLAPTKQKIPSSANPAPITIDDDLDIAQLAEELQKENELLQSENDDLKARIKKLESMDANAEVVRLEENFDRLNGHLQGQITTKNEAQKMVKFYADLLAKIRKILGVESNKDILAALAK